MSTTEVAVRPNMPSLKEVGYWLSLAESRDDNEKTRGAAGALRIYYALDLGLPAVAAAELSMIYGKLQVSARLLRALARKRGYDVERTDATEETCTAVLLDPDGREAGRTTYTLEMAQKAGIVKPKSSWETYPGRMCWARASAWVIYDFAPEVALGLIVEEEVGDVSVARGDSEYVDVPAGDVKEVDDDEALAEAQASFTELLDQLEANEDTKPPEPHPSWKAFANATSMEEFKRGDWSLLDVDELADLRQTVSDQAVPF